MEEKLLENSELPEAEQIEEIKDEETIPDESFKDIVIPVKFNKEIKNLTALEAASYAQKGMKFDMISKDFELLRELSQRKGKNVTQFLEELKMQEYSKRKDELLQKCGGDEEMAEHIIRLEEGKENFGLNGFEELKANFPKITSIEQLPEQVLENARLKGSLLLDEYLRYRLEEKKRSKEALKLQESNNNISLGSQLNRKAETSPETLEFLKGLWK